MNLLKGFFKKISTRFNISNLILFGSRARGNANKDSDFDLIIVSPDFKKKNFVERASKLYDYWDLNYPVDFICYTPEEFEDLRKRISLVAEALKYGVEIKT